MAKHSVNHTGPGWVAQALGPSALLLLLSRTRLQQTGEWQQAARPHHFCGKKAVLFASISKEVVPGREAG